MAARRPLGGILLGREVVVAYVLIVALYLGRALRVRPLQIPASLLISAYDIVEAAFPVLTPYYPLGFPLFLYLLALLGAGTARWLQADEEVSTPSRIVGGVCLIIGVLSLLLGGVVGGPLVSSTDSPTPLAVTGVTGLIFLGGAWWFLRGRSARRTSPDRTG